MAPHSSPLAWKIPRTEEPVGCSPWGREEPDMTEWLHFHFSLSCIGEGNGNPFQRSCLENPRDGGAWWAAVCGVAQSRTRLMWLSSSSSSVMRKNEISVEEYLRNTMEMEIGTLKGWSFWNVGRVDNTGTESGETEREHQGLHRAVGDHLPSVAENT